MPQHLLRIMFTLALGAIVLTVLWEFVASQPFAEKWFDAIPATPAISLVTAENFRFENYGASLQDWQALDKSMHKLLPLGTSRKNVEALLIRHAGSKAIANPKGSWVAYVHRRVAVPSLFCYPQYWKVLAQYDAENKLRALVTEGGCKDDAGFAGLPGLD